MSGVGSSVVGLPNTAVFTISSKLWFCTTVISLFLGGDSDRKSGFVAMCILASFALSDTSRHRSSISPCLISARWKYPPNELVESKMKCLFLLPSSYF